MVGVPPGGGVMSVRSPPYAVVVRHFSVPPGLAGGALIWWILAVSRPAPSKSVSFCDGMVPVGAEQVGLGGTGWCLVEGHIGVVGLECAPGRVVEGVGDHRARATAPRRLLGLHAAGAGRRSSWYEVT